MFVFCRKTLHPTGETRRDGAVGRAAHLKLGWTNSLEKIAEEEAEEDGEPLWPIDAPGEDDDIEDDIDENDEDDGVIH